MPENFSIDLYLSQDEDNLPLIPALEGNEEPEETITEIVKSLKKKKRRNRIENLDSKQIINQTSNIISTNKRRKQFI